ncbi:MAG: Wzz/FepE/Etk N-terminal domain-containing protein [Bacteroidia bacterium]
MEQSSTGSLFDSTNLVIFLWKKKTPIIIATLVAIIASVIFSSEYFIPPRFKSSVIMFPTTNSSISKSLLSENSFEKENILQFGEEEQVEQMLQILNSDEIRERIIDKYDLMSHYRIDTTGKYPQTELNKMFEENISFNRTEYLSVRIDVMDENPQLAAEIANEISSLLDTVKTRMQHERALQALAIVQKEYLDFNKYLGAREDTLNKLRLLGVLDYDSQVERLSEAYGKALLASNSSVVGTIDEKLAILAQYGGIYTSITQDMEHDREALSRLKTKYEESRVDATEKIPHKFVVNLAKAAEKKSYPVRWLIVLVSTVATFLLAVVTVIIIENIQRIRSRFE